MILGIGSDLANIERIAGVLERHGARFQNRVFTEAEQAKAGGRRDVAGTYAKRWAAKEACSKALGTGLRMGIAWRDMARFTLFSMIAPQGARAGTSPAINPPPDGSFHAEYGTAAPRAKGPRGRMARKPGPHGLSPGPHQSGRLAP